MTFPRIISENKTNSYDYLNQKAGQLCDEWDRTEKIKRVALAIFLVATLALLVVGFPYLAVPLFVAGFVALGALALTAFFILQCVNKAIKKEGENLNREMANFIKNCESGKPVFRPLNKAIKKEGEDLNCEHKSTEAKRLKIYFIHLERPLEGSSRFRCPCIVS